MPPTRPWPCASKPRRQVSAEEWNTGGYDWRALGQCGRQADHSCAGRPARLCAGRAKWSSCSHYATDEVDRGKVAIELPGQSVERAGNYLLLKGYQEALQPLLGNDPGGERRRRHHGISLDNPRLQGQVQWDDNLGIYSYNYTDDQGLQRTVYVESAGSLGRKLELLRKYNVSNVNLQLPANGDVDPAMARGAQELPDGRADRLQRTGQMAVAYTVYGRGRRRRRPADSPAGQHPHRTWPPASCKGDLRVDAQMVNAEGTALTAPQSAAIALASLPAQRRGQDRRRGCAQASVES